MYAIYKNSFAILLMLFSLSVLVSCRNNTAQTDKKETKDKQVIKTPEGTIMDPNQPKPMALMMRQMAANADSMRLLVLEGKVPDSFRFALPRFWLAEPTDPDVLKRPEFFENARLFQQAYKEMFHAKNIKDGYNAMVAKCINCHNDFCNGPLKRIRKMPIE